MVPFKVQFCGNGFFFSFGHLKMLSHCLSVKKLEVIPITVFLKVMSFLCLIVFKISLFFIHLNMIFFFLRQGRILEKVCSEGRFDFLGFLGCLTSSLGDLGC